MGVRKEQREIDVHFCDFCGQEGYSGDSFSLHLDGLFHAPRDWAALDTPLEGHKECIEWVKKEIFYSIGLRLGKYERPQPVTAQAESGKLDEAPTESLTNASPGQ